MPTEGKEESPSGWTRWVLGGAGLILLGVVIGSSMLSAPTTSPPEPPLTAVITDPPDAASPPPKSDMRDTGQLQAPRDLTDRTCTTLLAWLDRLPEERIHEILPPGSSSFAYIDGQAFKLQVNEDPHQDVESQQYLLDAGGIVTTSFENEDPFGADAILNIDETGGQACSDEFDL